MSTVTFSARSIPACQSFLKIKQPNSEYLTIEEFVKIHPTIFIDDLLSCDIHYRNTEMPFQEYSREFVSFTERLQFLRVSSSFFIVNPMIQAAHYYAEKAADCLQNARFFTINSSLIIDCKETSDWRYGYIAQFSRRCIYFGTAATWYSNTFDHLLQMVYWAYELFAAAKDRKGNPYDESWDVKKIMTFCTYDFVIAQLKSRGLLDIRKHLTSCFGAIQETRTWANYIKHKGGIEYSHLKPEPPVKVYFFPNHTSESVGTTSNNRFALEKFKAPIEVDIDEKKSVLECTHIALYECASAIIQAIDFDKYKLSFGG